MTYLHKGKEHIAPIGSTNHPASSSRSACRRKMTLFVLHFVRADSGDDDLAARVGTRSVWRGVYTAAQNERGRSVYQRPAGRATAKRRRDIGPR
jgi:hypothetical protein